MTNGEKIKILRYLSENFAQLGQGQSFKKYKGPVARWVFYQIKKSQKLWLKNQRWLHYDLFNLEWKIGQSWLKESRLFTRWVNQKLLFPQRLTMDSIARMTVKSIKDGFIGFKVLISIHIGLDCVLVSVLFWSHFKNFQSPNINHDCSLMTILAQSWQNHRCLHGALLNHDQKITKSWLKKSVCNSAFTRCTFESWSKNYKIMWIKVSFSVSLFVDSHLWV